MDNTTIVSIRKIDFESNLENMLFFYFQNEEPSRQELRQYIAIRDHESIFKYIESSVGVNNFILHIDYASRMLQSELDNFDILEKIILLYVFFPNFYKEKMLDDVSIEHFFYWFTLKILINLNVNIPEEKEISDIIEKYMEEFFTENGQKELIYYIFSTYFDEKIQKNDSYV